MVNVQPTNKKLEDRARRIIEQATEVTEERAAELLDQSGRKRANGDRDGEKESLAGKKRKLGFAVRGKDQGSATLMDKFLIQGGTPLGGRDCGEWVEELGSAGAGGFAADGRKGRIGADSEGSGHPHHGKLLALTGAGVRHERGLAIIEAAELTRPEAPYEVVKTMRASSLVLGPLVARCGRPGSRCRAVAPSGRGR